VTQTGDYPRADTTTLTVSGRGDLDLRLRIPSWARQDFSVKLNNQAYAVRAGSDGYASISRTWRDGDKVEVRFPFRLRTESALDDPGLRALLYGPVALIAKSASASHLPLPLDLVPAGQPMTFRSGAVLFEPFYRGDTDAYHVYFRAASR
jgi:uncharacterized protein